MSDPRQDRFRRAEQRLLADQLTDYHACLLARNNTVKHANLTRTRVARVLEVARMERISELSVASVQSAINTLRASGLSLETCNHHVRAMRMFSRWLHRNGLCRDESMLGLTTFNAATDRRHDRRDLTPDQAIQLIGSAEREPRVLKMSGPERAMLYRLALGTGFRVRELRSLTPESFDLAGTHPTVTVRAGYSKNRDEAVQPIARELAEMLAPWLKTKLPGVPVFTMPNRTAEMLRHDLEAAGIPESDGAGRVIDFHALRHTYISHLVASGVSVKVARVLARHSTPTLTIGRYAHASQHDVLGALDKLPNLSKTQHPDEAMGIAG